MELLTLDKDLNPIRYLRYSNLQWIRKYYEAGEFSVQCPISEYTSDIVYIYTKDRPEVGVVNKIEYRVEATGETVQISGYFFEFKLYDKIVYPRFTASGRVEDIARNMVLKYKSDIPFVRIRGAQSGYPDTASIQESNEELGSVLYRFLQAHEMTFVAQYQPKMPIPTMEVFVKRGLDRTQDQTENPYCTFSTGFRNMNNIHCTIDNSNFKNYAIVVGNGKYEDGKQVTVYVDKSNGGYKQQIYVDATSETYDSTKQTLAEYKAGLKQKGEEKLLEYALVQNVEFNTDTHQMEYMKDFDIGDLCDVVVEPLQLSFKARIIEIYEVFKNNTHEISLVFGDKIPTLYRKARLQ